MDGVTAEFTLEVLVGFEQHDLDALASQQERQHGAARPAADHTAVDRFDVPIVSKVLELHGPIVSPGRRAGHERNRPRGYPKSDPAPLESALAIDAGTPGHTTHGT